MPPRHSTNRKTSESAPSTSLHNMSSPAKSIQKNPSPKSPRKNGLNRVQKTGLTQLQKRALIENLQLEITERARRLRAQYALQAQGLRTRIEIRINRIPVALRNVQMGDLLLKYSEASKKDNSCYSRIELKSPSKNHLQPAPRTSPIPQRGTKRMSNAILTDKENNHDLGNTPKRSRRSPHQNSPSRIPASQVLSPRSANSRLHSQSPVRLAPPENPGSAYSISPQKSNLKATTVGSTTVSRNVASKIDPKRKPHATQKSGIDSSRGTGRGKRLPAASTALRSGRGRISVGSQNSNSSSNTVRKILPVRKPPIKEKQAQTKRGVIGTIKAIGGQRKPTTDKTPADTTSGRVLRKRK
ncbi:hypothetical protein GcC1_210033 [Golovinomyces cichoracearum]|uniref:Borealin N-terminal domain-containing protein n=1 Tax=Golovinomyces cichoracearum TaxID=62708 RepID=A0A420HAZ4_9PEZI|nr:hypothetical protein GcC1_210033 [Golovinomyces cichoracearum]